MRTSEQINEIALAMATAQADIGTVKKDKRAAAGKYSYTYASLAAVVESVIPGLSKNGLAFAQSISQDETHCVVSTRIMHKSGQWIEGDCRMPVSGNNAQAVGSAITYGRRYGLCSLIGVVADDNDEDGQAATRDPAPKKSLSQTVAAKAPAPARSVAMTGFINALRACTSMDSLDALAREIPKDKLSEQEINDARVEYAQIKAKMIEKVLAGGE